MKLSHHLLLLVLLATPCFAKNALTKEIEPTALQKCKIRDAAEKTQVTILKEYITKGYTFKNITMNGKPLLATTTFSSAVVKLLLDGGADPLATITNDKGESYSCLEEWAIRTRDAKKRRQKEQKIQSLSFMILWLFKRRKHAELSRVEEILKGHSKILTKLPTPSSKADTCDS